MTNSTITVKFQTTIPKVVRERLGMRVNDVIERRVLKGKAEVVPAHGVPAPSQRHPCRGA